MGQNGRNFERLDHKIAITSDSEDNFYTGFSENISEEPDWFFREHLGRWRFYLYTYASTNWIRD